MTTEPNIAVLIPCFNEEITIGKVIDDFRAELPRSRIIVFDNNSSDRTAEIAKIKGALVYKEKRQGKGFVVTSMFERIDADVYVMVDGDDTYPAAAVHDLIRPIVQDEADMTVGTRLKTFTSQSFRPLHVFGNRLVITLVNWIFDSDLHDIMSGYRAFGRSLVKSLPLSSRSFEVETQMVMQSLYYDFVIQEVEIAYRERPEGSHSKLRTFVDGAHVIRTIVDIAKAYRPLFFFGLLGSAFLAAGLALGAIPIVEFISTQRISRFPTAILATGLVLMSAISFAIGVILDSINFRVREILLANRKRGL